VPDRRTTPSDEPKPAGDLTTPTAESRPPFLLSSFPSLVAPRTVLERFICATPDGPTSASAPNDIWLPRGSDRATHTSSSTEVPPPGLPRESRSTRGNRPCTAGAAWIERSRVDGLRLRRWRQLGPFATRWLRGDFDFFRGHSLPPENSHRGLLHTADSSVRMQYAQEVSPPRFVPSPFARRRNEIP